MKKSATVFLQFFTGLIGIAALAFLLWEPHLEGRNVGATWFEIYFNDPFLAYIYLGSIPFFVGLYQAFKALGLVYRGSISSQVVMNALRIIRNCAIVTIGVIAGAEVVIAMNTSDDRAGGVFMGLLVAFGSTIVAIVAARFERMVRHGTIHH